MSYAEKCSENSIEDSILILFDTQTWASPGLLDEDVIKVINLLAITSCVEVRHRVRKVLDATDDTDDTDDTLTGQRSARWK